MTTPPTPPRPERVATADLVAQARAVARDAESRRPGGCAVVPIALLFALAKALEAEHAEVERLRERLADIDDGRHIVELDENGWALKHPLECRDASMLDCAVHAACREWDEQPAPPGRYVAVLADDGSLMLGAADA